MAENMRSSLKVLSFFVLFGAILFQNCSGEFVVSTELTSEQVRIEEMKKSDQEILPGLLASAKLVVWMNQEGLKNKLTEPLFLDSATVIVAIKNQPGAVVELSAVDVQSLKVAITQDGEVKVEHTTLGSVSTYLAAEKSAQETRVVAARFGKSATDLALMVDGILVGTERDVKSTSAVESGKSFSFLQMQLQVDRIDEVMIFSEPLQPQAMNSLSRYLAQERGLPEIPYFKLSNLVPEGSGNPNFKPVQNILSQKCLGCHSWAGLSEVDLLSKKTSDELGFLIKAKDLENSRLWVRLIGVIDGPGFSKNMPSKNNVPAGTNAEPLSSEELTLVKNWILSGGQ
jgi:hypothetical protein